jgi:hypothetical protein
MTLAQLAFGLVAGATLSRVVLQGDPPAPGLARAPGPQAVADLARQRQARAVLDRLVDVLGARGQTP